MILTKREILSIALVIFILLNLFIFSIINDAFENTRDSTSIPIAISYPPFVNGKMQDNWLQINFELTANETMSEGTNLTITNVEGTAFIDLNKWYNNETSGNDIRNIWIGFQYAQPWKTFTVADTSSEGKLQNHFLTGLDGNWLMVLHNETTWLEIEDNPYTQGFCPIRTFVQMTFNFPTSGEYSPSIIVSLDNGTFLTHTYDQIKIPILSNVALREESRSKIDLILTIALFAFTELEGLKILHSAYKKAPIKRTKKSNNVNFVQTHF